MSHFTVVVIGDDIEAQLAPFHEFECTGVDDQYIQNVDQLAEARAKYEGMKDDYPTFARFCAGWYGSAVLLGGEPDLAEKHKYGWMRATEDGDVVELIDRTNPNAKWDWWQVGGRWTGFFKLKPGAKGSVGEPGLLTAPADSLAGYADIARVGDIDFAAMRDEKGAKAGARFDKVHSVIAGRTVLSWVVVRDAHPGDIEAARAVYAAQEVVRDLHASKDDEVRWSDMRLEEYLVTREQYVQSARNAAGIPFAIVKDGTWYERGKMGWWACVSDAKPEGEWEREAASLIDGLPEATLLTAVDCHV